MPTRPIQPDPAINSADPLACFHPATAAWFRSVFEAPTAPQRMGWPAIARGESTLILAPTGTGKTLTAFLWCLDRLMMRNGDHGAEGQNGCRVVYVSPLKALAVDVERNLRAPLAGIAETAQRMGVAFREPAISIRTGDTPQRERARFARHPAEILITTPESLYLLLTSQAARALRTVETVIVDEIHALVPTKRGAHLALTLERLEAITAKPLQRIGLSATQRPLEEVAHFLGGVELQGLGIREQGSEKAGASSTFVTDETLKAEDSESAENSLLPGPAVAEPLRYRPVTIVDASAPKPLKLRIEVPVEDMARMAEMEAPPSGPSGQKSPRVSIWNAIHPRLLELIRARHSTILFVNSRQVAERLAGALNDLAGEPIARAHHGSLAAAQRADIEEQLKAGKIRALCATSTLELGIDMGAVDLVIQIESPPSIASGIQRIGRAGHRIDAVSEGILFPKFRADLVACAAIARAMHEGQIESTHYPRNPLDVLAQQIVAIVASRVGNAKAGSREQGAGKRKAAAIAPGLFDENSQAQSSVEGAPLASSANAANNASSAFSVDALYNLVRRAAPFGSLTRAAFEGVLDLLSGRYPSDEFADLRPRLNWDRIRNLVTAREGAALLAILNAGTIPDRGLYGVFLAANKGKPVRVGELDEEMVFESHTNDTFILGASTWRITEITHDRVLVEPAPGEPGKMPFWKGDGPGRPLEFGRRIGAMIRELRALPRQDALTRLVSEHDLDPGAAENLLQFLADQASATGQIPDDHTIVVERCRDELGDWRICVLTPFGSRIHIPWAMAISARIAAAGGPEVEPLWADDGFVLRFPDTDAPPDADWIRVASAEAMQLVLRQLGSTALFAGRFREAAGRALLLPRRRADQRSPLWQLRKRSADLLSIAARYPSFPLILESYRECLRDVFDMPALIEILREVEGRKLRVHVVDTRKPSPFAASLLFSYVANYVYDGDAPLAERRAQALTIDQDQLRDLLGESDLRELLDPEAIAEVENTAQCLAENYRARSADAMHDLCLRLGDLSRTELARRIAAPELLAQLDDLVGARRLVELRIAGETRFIAAEDAARYRDGLGIALPPGLAAAFLAPVAHPRLELLRRYARTHGPFTPREAAARFALETDAVEQILHQLAREGRILEGGFRPGGVHREWCDAEILRQIRRKSLAKLRREVEPVEPQTLARFLTHWQGIAAPRRASGVPSDWASTGQSAHHLDALLDAIESLQGAPLPASLVESAILPARVAGYDPSGLDALIAAGEVVWAGIEPIGERDGRIALFLADHLPLLTQNRPLAAPLSEREEKLLVALSHSGASFFEPLHQAIGGGYPGETIDALWSLLWRGLVTNDSLHALRAYIAKPESSRTPRRFQTGVVFRSRRTTPPTAQGRWAALPLSSFANVKSTSFSVKGTGFGVKGTGFSPYENAPLSSGALAPEGNSGPTATERSHALALQLLNRYGVLLREEVAAENIPGGFSTVYDVLKALEESGRIRRGYFVGGLGATQFALPAAVDLLRQLRAEPEEPEFVLLAAADPANPYGSALRWPELPVAEEGAESGAHMDRSSSVGRESAPRILTRSANAEVILRNGHLILWRRQGNPNLLVFLPDEEPERAQAAAGLAHFLRARGQEQMRFDSHGGVLITTINGRPAAAHFLARFLIEASFHSGPLGMQLRRTSLPSAYE